MQATRLEYTDRAVSLVRPMPRGNAFTFPVSRPERITSQFGPRWKATEERSDFHRGIDFYGAPREPIFSIGKGEVYRVYEEGGKVFPNGGNTLVIRHKLETPFDFHGHQVDRLFSLYLHLDECLVKTGEAVERGQQVAAMGSSGNTRFNHLHFETRLATTCSLEFQRNHPGSPSAAFGFDPHVHPFLFVDGACQGKTYISHEPGAPFVVNFHASRGDLNLNRIRGDGGLLDFNLRAGIDAATTSALDDFDFGWVRLLPEHFSGRSKELVYRLEFPRQPAFVEFTDIHGEGLRRDYH